MAISPVVMANEVPASKLPSGYTRPTVVPVTGNDDELSNHTVDFTVSKVTVEDAVKITTVDQLIAALKVLVDAEITAAFSAVPTVTASAILKDVKNNQGFDSEFWSDAVDNYVCTVEYIVKSV